MHGLVWAPDVDDRAPPSIGATSAVASASPLRWFAFGRIANVCGRSGGAAHTVGNDGRRECNPAQSELRRSDAPSLSTPPPKLPAIFPINPPPGLPTIGVGSSANPGGNPAPAEAPSSGEAAGVKRPPVGCGSPSTVPGPTNPQSKDARGYKRGDDPPELLPGLGDSGRDGECEPDE
eukprot:scaffold38552_cov30-Tisochrysis_lutea.AAC.5